MTCIYPTDLDRLVGAHSENTDQMLHNAASGRKMDVLKNKDMYGKKLRCIYSKYGMCVN